MSRPLNRRQFLGRTLAAGAGAALALNAAPRVLADKDPNEKLNLAFVGVANKGMDNIQNLKADNVYALCDIDSNLLGQAAQQFPKAVKYRDYRDMFDKEGKNIDAVVVSTADHSHAPATSIALSLGKHVYCEKPLTHTVTEARHIARLAAKNKCVTQMGTQIHASDNYRRVVELIQAKAIGTVKEVYTWCNKGWSDGRFKPAPKPDNVDWELWLGPAKERPYCEGIHPFNWRRFWEYGSGTFGDMACHIMDLPFWALGLTKPDAVRATGPEVHPDGAPAWCLCQYDFPGQGDRPPVKLYWSDGGKHEDIVANTMDHEGKPLSGWGLGILFVGDKGMLAADYGRRQLLPKEQFSGFKAPPETITKSIGHWAEFAQACKTGGPTTCNFEYSGNLTETVLLGVVAYRSGKELKWDGKNLKVTNTDAADRFLTKEYRKGFAPVGLG